MGDPLDLDELLAAWLARIEHEGEAALEAACAAHPGAAAGLRERVRLLRAAGLLEPAAGEPPAASERLGGFRLVRRLGQGPAGVVHLARRDAEERPVALTAIRPEHLRREGARGRFAREVEAAARLAHPGIAAVHGVGEDRGVAYVATEYAPGASLERVCEVLRGRNPVSLTGNDLLRVVAAEVDLRPDADVALRPPFDGSWEAACAWIAREAAQALEHAHQRGLLHRGVQPASVVLTPEGRVLLVDLGLAALEDAGGAPLGSPAGLAPEQLEGRAERVGPATDVHGLGVTLYTLLALRPPHGGEGEAEDPEALRRAVLKGAAPRLRAVCPSASADACAVVARAMALEPQDRYAGAADLARDLTRLLEQQPVEARAPGAWLQLARWTRRHRAASTALALALLVAVAGPLLFGLRQHALGERLRAERERAERARAAAEDERARSDERRAVAERERAEALAQRGLAERRREQAEARGAQAEGGLERALEAVEGMLGRVSQERLVGVPRLEQVRHGLLTEGRRLHAALGSAGGEVERGAAVRRRAGALGVALADLERQLGDPEAARALLEEQVADLRALGGEGGQGRHRADLALALARLAAIELDRAGPERALELSGEGLALLEEGLVVGTLDGRAWLELLAVRKQAFARLGREQDALRAADRLLEVARRQLDRSPDDPEARRVLAVALGERGRLALGRDPAEAVEHLERGFEELRALLREQPDEVLARLDLCDLAAILPGELGRLGRRERALEVAEEGVAAAAALVREFPAAASYRLRLETLRVEAGVAAAALGRADRAVEELGAACAGLEELAAAHPGAPELRRHLGAALSALAAAQLQGGRLDEVAGPLDRAIAAHRAALELEPRDGGSRLDLARALLQRGLLALEQGEWDRAPAALEEAGGLLAEPAPAAEAEQPRAPGPPGPPGPSAELARLWALGLEGVAGDEALAPEVRQALAATFARGALEALAAAVEAGAVDAAGLATDPDWGALRGLSGFEGLAPPPASPAGR